jgi:hypothetical protein
MFASSITAPAKFTFSNVAPDKFTSVKLDPDKSASSAFTTRFARVTSIVSPNSIHPSELWPCRRSIQQV